MEDPVLQLLSQSGQQGGTVIDAIRIFLFQHPWIQAAVFGFPTFGLTALIAWRESHHAKIANRLRGERNEALARIADNTRRTPTQAENNATRLRKYLSKIARVSEGNNYWGNMGAEIVEVSGENILTLFIPAGSSSATASAVYVHCDNVQIIEEPYGGCALQIKVLERYGEAVNLGEIKRWEDKGTTANAPRARGPNAFQSTYHLAGSPNRRAIYVYAPTEGNPQYTLVTTADNKETGVLYGDHVNISKKFAAIQIDWLAEGFQRDGGSTGVSPGRLFLFTA
jgi:hypothetical protein